MTNPPEPQVPVIAERVELRPRVRIGTPMTKTQLATNQQRARGWRI